MRGCGFNFEFSMDYDFDNHSGTELFLQVNDFIPSRPAPACNNPDSPSFSDCGDDAEYDEFLVHIVIRHQGKVFFIPLPDDMYLLLEDELIDRIFNEGEKKYQKMLDDEYDYFMSHYEKESNKWVIK